MLSLECMSQRHCKRDLRPKPDFQDTLRTALHDPAVAFLLSFLTATPHSTYRHTQPHPLRARPSLPGHAVPAAHHAFSPPTELGALTSKIQFKCCFVKSSCTSPMKTAILSSTLPRAPVPSSTTVVRTLQCNYWFLSPQPDSVLPEMLALIAEATQ